MLSENSERNSFVCKVGDNIMTAFKEMLGWGLDSTGSAQGTEALLTYAFSEI